MGQYEDLEKLKENLNALYSQLSSESGEVNFEDIMNEMDMDLEQLEKDMVEGRTLLPLPYKVIHPDAVTPKYNYDGGWSYRSYCNNRFSSIILAWR